MVHDEHCSIAEDPAGDVVLVGHASIPPWLQYPPTKHAGHEYGIVITVLELGVGFR